MVGRKKTDEATRFWEKIDVRGPDECWPWTAGTHKGYGTFREAGAPLGIKAPAHAVAFRYANGRSVRDGYEIDHICNNPRCCNAKHLEEVTHSENMRRIWKRKRGRTGARCGSNHPLSTLSVEDVEAIRRDTRPGTVIAKEFGVTKHIVSGIKTGKRYTEHGIKTFEHR